jgi:hypothetical protein
MIEYQRLERERAKHERETFLGRYLLIILYKNLNIIKFKIELTFYYL